MAFLRVGSGDKSPTISPTIVYENTKSATNRTSISLTETYTIQTDGLYSISFEGSNGDRNNYYYSSSISLTVNGASKGSARGVNAGFADGSYGGSTILRSVMYTAELKAGAVIKGTLNSSSVYNHSAATIMQITKII